MKKIICITTYPPRECGIATFAQDLIRNIMTKFGDSYSIKVCAVESDTEKHVYSKEVEYTLDTSDAAAFGALAVQLNTEREVEMILVQHEFGLFHENRMAFLQLLEQLCKPVVLIFHTVLSHPSSGLYAYIGRMAVACDSLVVMTYTSYSILEREYHVPTGKLTVIPHGTHLVSLRDKKKLKEIYYVSGRRILSTFGLLSAGKSVETTLKALPEIVKKNPTVLFLIIGKTHPMVLKAEGEAYREMLKAQVANLELEEYVRFVNCYLELPVLLEYLQLTDIYLFTSSDPCQAVSGTFVYALSCGCPIVATPIPHALELLSDESGVIFDFKDSAQLAIAVNRLLADEASRSEMQIAGLQKTAGTAWENSAIAYALLFRTIGEKEREPLVYSLPPINIRHILRMTRQWGIVQFAKGNRPDLKTGYTLDDNARALIALCQIVASGINGSCTRYIKTYLELICYCQQPDGSFLNYIDKNHTFTNQNKVVGLEDSNGRGIWALGYFIFYGRLFPDSWVEEARVVLQNTFQQIRWMKSLRSIAFALKGLYYYNLMYPSDEVQELIRLSADKLARCYRLTAKGKWNWFETYLTYDNSILPEAMLLAYLATEDDTYKTIARKSFDFLLEKLFPEDHIRVVSNQGWMHKEKECHKYGEQPVDVAGCVIALSVFYRVFPEEEYLIRQRIAFNWFLGHNQLHQIVYNPATGGCYDGLEENNVNLNQGAESTTCYLMARMSLE
ncbi:MULTISPECIES: glycosyltransferase [Bacteroides]|uniref:glycosyltransferase n=1 Tax=Bacteroides TaxID=816 RepID=UPI00259CE1D1|nr:MULTISPECIES: glycosyltransferase [Bacteroides]